MPLIKKKYRFETAYVNEDGIQSSSFEMFIKYKDSISENLLDELEKFIDSFDHAIMFSSNHTECAFLDSSSKRKVILENVDTVKVTPVLFAYLVLHILSEKEIKFVKEIEVNDTDKTSYIVTKNDIKKVLGESLLFKIPQLEGC